ncbi:MAG: hypothetical protein F6K41_10295, partial [Symploca sp. SIO3E6]|nr:hypothetical protein [Caldora sp. SIO3E6]
FCLLPSAFCLLPSAFCLLPSAFCLLPPAFCLLPPASCLLPSPPLTVTYPNNNFELIQETRYFAMLAWKTPKLALSSDRT